MRTAARAPHVHKFGGASLADAAAIGRATGIVRGHRPEPAVVVVSAIAGATDALLAIARHAERGERDAAARLLRALRARYVRAARAVGPRGAEGRKLLPSSLNTTAHGSRNTASTSNTMKMSANT